MQESFWWWRCSDRYIISLCPHLQTPFPPFSPSQISLVVSVEVKHHVYLLTYIRKVLLCEAGWTAFQTASATQKWTAMEVNWGNNIGGKIGHYHVLKDMKGDESDVPYKRALSFKSCVHQNCWLNTVLQMVLWFCIHCHWYVILCVCNKGYLPTISFAPMARKVLCESHLCLWQKQNKQTKTSANNTSFVSVKHFHF